MKECINCELSNSKLANCIIFKPRNAARINEKRKEFLEACGDSGNQNFQQRYHAEEVEERFGKFKPGVIRYLFSFHLLFWNTSSAFGVPDFNCQSLLSLPAALYYECVMFEFAKWNFNKLQK